MYMKVFRNLLLLGILGVLLQFACTTLSPVDPAANRPPDTFITYFTVDVVANEDGSFTTTIFWRGADEDGEVASFQFRVNGGAWTSTTQAQTTMDLAYALQTTTHLFEVKSIDNLGAEDSTPAQINLSKGFERPVPVILAGPPNGASTGLGVMYTIGGTDVDGFISKVMWDMDNSGVWTTVDADTETGSADLQFIVGAGAHTFTFMVEDNTGNVSDAAATATIFAEAGYTPIIQQTQGPTDGGGWFEGAAATFTWRGETGHYYGSVVGYSYSLDDGTLNADGSYAGSGAEWLDYSDPASVALDMPAGDHTVYLGLMDLGGGITYQENVVSVAAPTFDQGVLLVNGVHWGTYGAQITDKFDASAYWGTVPVTFWDLFQGGYDPPTLDASIGTGAIPPDVLAQYSTVVWLANQYQGDEVAWFGSPMLAYLQAGGNLILTSRYGHDLFDDNLTDYAHIAWREAGSSAATIIEYEPVFPGLESMEGAGGFLRGMTATDVFSGGGFLDSTDDNTVTNWDGVSSYTKSDMTSTLLFAHRSDGGLAGSPFSYVRGLGSWAHPNLVYAAQTDVTLPTPGTAEAMGNFIYLAGRHYGFDIAACTTNFEFMIAQLCGEQ